MRSPISCRLIKNGVALDGVPVVLSVYKEEKDGGGRWDGLGTGSTDEAGYTHNLLPVKQDLVHGRYRLVIVLSSITKALIFPHVDLEFLVTDASIYHFLILLNDNSYTVARIPLLLSSPNAERSDEDAEDEGNVPRV